MLIITAAHSGGDKTFTYPCVIEGWSSWPWWPVIYRDGLPVVHRRSTTQVLTRQCTAGSWTRNLVVARYYVRCRFYDQDCLEKSVRLNLLGPGFPPWWAELIIIIIITTTISYHSMISAKVPQRRSAGYEAPRTMLVRIAAVFLWDGTRWDLVDWSARRRAVRL